MPCCCPLCPCLCPPHCPHTAKILALPMSQNAISRHVTLYTMISCLLHLMCRKCIYVLDRKVTYHATSIPQTSPIVQILNMRLGVITIKWLYILSWEECTWLHSGMQYDCCICLVLYLYSDLFVYFCADVFMSRLYSLTIESTIRNDIYYVYNRVCGIC